MGHSIDSLHVLSVWAYYIDAIGMSHFLDKYIGDSQSIQVTI